MTSGFPVWSSDMLLEGQPSQGGDMSCVSRIGTARVQELSHVTGINLSSLLRANQEAKDRTGARADQAWVVDLGPEPSHFFPQGVAISSADLNA